MKALISVMLMFLVSTQTWAWGGRGHNIICETAVFFVKDKNLKSFLTKRPHVMGHLCNIPDVYWKSLGEISKAGDYGHFIDVEVIGEKSDMKTEDIPTIPYPEMIKKFQGSKSEYLGRNIINLNNDFGSLWWRAEQFYRLAVEAGQKAAKSTPPEPQQRQDYSLPYNQGVYDMMVNMGLLGHFIGDASQPLHSTSDYDGYKQGHGGLHAYYEEDVVGEIDGHLSENILKKAASVPAKELLKINSPIEKIKWMTVKFHKEIPQLLKLDKMLEKSELDTSKGMQIRKPAKRPPAATMVSVFEPMIVNEMAHSTVVLAQMWDEIYEKAGKPNLEPYGSYKYPLTPDFVAPDYLSMSPTSGK